MLRFSLIAATALTAVVVQSSSADAQFGSRFSAARTVEVSSGPGVGYRAAWARPSTWGDYWAYNQSMNQPWHGEYYWLRTGQPTALIVPPTVTMQSNYSWGVSQNTMTPIYHQFSGKASNGGGGGVFKATPYWPSHTDQFGVYPVRGPW
ncbi:hypothetical protein VN12_11370 [Pirellula sp. SH-Sr6A]|uniref:hypothetical protein n=1 Tax=Pirellula sp. SH-Sr6A TaxID=1632865 RepID=UPI00078C0925|nr:hypothetical protein [Pirellula sp. SH-Sr6A]AMV32715.1 hypothetical protein VN12_11370 [Pirellula sp. SH-Sr6A]